jgi:hypothetical protein
MRFAWVACVAGAVVVLLFVLVLLAVPGAVADFLDWMTALALAGLALCAASVLARVELGRRESEAERLAWQLRGRMALGVFGLLLALYLLSMQANVAQVRQPDLFGTITCGVLAIVGLWTAAESLLFSLPLVRSSRSSQG